MPIIVTATFFVFLVKCQLKVCFLKLFFFLKLCDSKGKNGKLYEYGWITCSDPPAPEPSSLTEVRQFHQPKRFGALLSVPELLCLSRSKTSLTTCLLGGKMPARVPMAGSNDCHFT